MLYEFLSLHECGIIEIPEIFSSYWRISLGFLRLWICGRKSVFQFVGTDA